MDFKKARRHMVDSQVRPNDVTDLRLLAAMEEIPREVFLPTELRNQAYVEHDVGFAQGRYLLRARDFAKLVSAAAPKSNDLVLNAVSGSGYSTAVLSHLVEMVVAVEKNEELSSKAEENLTTLGVSNAAVIVGDPAQGAPKQGPFDLIFIGGAIEVEPTSLLQQLKDGGRLAALKLRDGLVRGVVIHRTGDVFAESVAFDAASQLVLPEFKAEKSFVF